VPFNCEACISPLNRCGKNHQEGILLCGNLVASNIISVTYDTPLNNNPKKNKNWIAVWEGSYINCETKPIAQTFIESTNRHSSYAFDTLTLKTGQDYIVGYGVGDSITSVAATLFFPWEFPAFKPGKATRTLVRPTEIGNNYITIHYCTPLGNNPKMNDNWIGIQQGKTFTYEYNRFKKHPIKLTENSGEIAINNYHFKPNKWYTIVYGIGNNSKDIAASWTFNGNQANDRCKTKCPHACK